MVRYLANGNSNPQTKINGTHQLPWNSKMVSAGQSLVNIAFVFVVADTDGLCGQCYLLYLGEKRHCHLEKNINALFLKSTIALNDICVCFVSYFLHFFSGSLR